MKKGKFQLLLLCSLVGLGIFFVDNVTAAETSAYSMGNLSVQGSIGKIEDGVVTQPSELENEILVIHVLISKKTLESMPQTGVSVSNLFITLLGMLLVVIGWCYLFRLKGENRRGNG